MDWAALADAINGGVQTTANIGFGIYNAVRQSKNDDYSRQRDYADKGTANDMLRYYLQNGSIDGMKVSDFYQSGRNYADVADMLSPLMSLNSVEMSRRQQSLSEEAFKTQKDIAFNGSQIKVNDLKKAGLSPLLATGATGQSVSLPSVSSSAGSSSGMAKNYQQNFTPLQYLQVQNLMSDIAVKSATAKDLESSSKLKQAQTTTEALRPSEINMSIKEKEAQISYVKENTKKVIEEVKNLPYLRMLTQNQIEYYATELLMMDWDLNLSKDYSIKTSEQLPQNLNAINAIVEHMGVDPNSQEGKALSAIGFLILAVSGSKFGNSNTKTVIHKLEGQKK